MIVLELLVIVALVLVNAVFAGSEIAVVAARRGKLQQLAADGSRGAEAVLQLRAEPERFFATVQVGISVVGATAGAWGGATFAEHIEPLIGLSPWMEEHAEAISVAVVVALVSYLSIVLGELVPKSLALKYAESYASLIARPLRALSWLVRPVIWFLTLSSNLILRPFGDRTAFSEGRISPEELQELVKEASTSGTVDPHVGEITSRAISLTALRAKDVMTPREKIDAIPSDAGVDDLREILLEQGHSRMPVYDGTLDHIVGYVVAKDIFHLVWQRDLIILADVLRPAYFVSEDTLARNVLRELQARHTQLALVRDAQLRVTGLLTVEDIVEHLVGDLAAEDEA